MRTMSAGDSFRFLDLLEFDSVLEPSSTRTSFELESSSEPLFGLTALPHSLDGRKTEQERDTLPPVTPATPNNSRKYFGANARRRFFGAAREYRAKEQRIGPVPAAMSPECAPPALDSVRPPTARADFLAACRNLELHDPESTIIRRERSSKLQLAHYGLGPKRASALSAALERLPELEVLDMSDCRLNDEAVLRTLESLGRRSCGSCDNSGLVDLRMSRSTLRPRSACISMGCYVALSKTLTSLCLSHCKLGDREVCAMAEGGLSDSGSLITLDLSSNTIGLKGGIALGIIVSKVKTLRTLKLSYNLLRLEGASAIARSVQDSLLTTLDLAHNGFGRVDGTGRSAAMDLARALTINETLADLDLTGNGISPPTACVIGNP